jgi:hypothetical protein
MQRVFRSVFPSMAVVELVPDAVVAAGADDTAVVADEFVKVVVEFVEVQPTIRTRQVTVTNATNPIFRI